MEVLIKGAIVCLEAMFVLGWLGSVAVLVLTGIEDVEILMESDKPQTQ